MSKEAEVILKFLEQGILIGGDAKTHLQNFPDKLNSIFGPEITYINKDLLEFLNSDNLSEINWLEFEKTRAIFEKTGKKICYDNILAYFKNDSKKDIIHSDVKIISSFKESSSKKEVSDFAMYFNSRLDMLQKILYSRDELKSVTSITRILSKKDRENVSLIGLVADKQVTKNHNIMLTLEDSTGSIKVLINKNKPEIYDIAKDTVLDEVIGISGVNGSNIVFANNLILPDVPISNELKKCEKDVCAIFLSDIHVGSDKFLEGDFQRFLNWINQKVGSEKQKELASKIKYIFIAGDLVDGVGIYPNQEEDLAIKDIYDQYKMCAELLAKIPKTIQIIICPGNHDALRLAEPQPPFQHDIFKPLVSLPNVIAVSNPSLVNIESGSGFSGFNILLYHGYSFDYFIANVDSIRNNGGYDRADLIMKFLLKRRHLAPTHTSTLYIPYTNIDPLVIDITPDFFVTGHIHKSAVASYKNITLISGSCWQAKTDFQEKMGHHPEPSRVPLVNLSTREIKILRFGK